MALRLFFSKMAAVTEGGFSFRDSKAGVQLRLLGPATYSTVEVGPIWALTCADVSDAEAAALDALPEIMEIPLRRDGRGWVDWAGARLSGLNVAQRGALLSFLEAEFGVDASGLSGETLLSELLGIVGSAFHGPGFDMRHTRAFGATEPPAPEGTS